jgi:Mannosyl-glycoprotein endo-beta-N-acetylglucosaminidase
VDVDSVETVDAPAPGEVRAVDADASAPLPVWLQAHKATTLWSGPDDNAVTLTDLPQWTFLKVAGVERNGRILVNYAGDYASRQPGIGWVDQAAIGPAGDPGVWVTNHRATSLWSGIDDKAVKFTDLPQWTKLRIVPDAPADPSRMEVQFFGDGLTRQPGTAWIAVADIGPITPPVPLPTLPVAGQQAQHQTFGTGNDFIAAVGAAAQSSMKSTGVPASVTVAQAILESDWGRSRLSRQGNNLFGIKALGNATGPAGVFSLATWEHTDDGDVIVEAPFRAYYTLEQSIDDHGKFFNRNRRYAAAMAVANDARAFARAIQDAGYATDPSYADKLIGLMDRYDLYRFDQ